MKRTAGRRAISGKTQVLSDPLSDFLIFNSLARILPIQGEMRAFLFPPFRKIRAGFCKMRAGGRSRVAATFVPVLNGLDTASGRTIFHSPIAFAQ